MDEAAIIPILYNMWRALPGLELGNSRTRKTLGLYDREIGWVGKGRMKGKGNNCINKGPGGACASEGKECEPQERKELETELIY